MEGDDDNGHDDVDQGHDGRHPLGDAGDPAYSAQDDQGGQPHQHRGGGARAQVQRGVRADDPGDGVGLDHDDGEAAGEDRQSREGDTQGAAAHPARHVVGGPAAEGAVGVTDLEHLGQGRLEEGGGHPDQGDHPHPEDRTGAAQDEGGGHSEDITDAHAGGQGDREGLEGGDASLSPGTRSGHLAEHVRQAAELHETGAGGQQDPGTDEHPHGDVERDPVRDGLELSGEGIHGRFSLSRCRDRWGRPACSHESPPGT